MFHGDHDPEMSQFFTASVKGLAKEMANWSEYSPE